MRYLKWGSKHTSRSFFYPYVPYNPTVIAVHQLPFLRPSDIVTAAVAVRAAVHAACNLTKNGTTRPVWVTCRRCSACGRPRGMKSFEKRNFSKKWNHWNFRHLLHDVQPSVRREILQKTQF